MNGSTLQRVIFDDKKLTQMTRRDGTKEYRLRTDGGITATKLDHDDGVFFLYENKTKNQALHEEITLELKGLDYSGDFKLLSAPEN